MARPISPNNRNVMRGTKLRLCAMRFEVPIPPAEGDKGPKTLSDRVLDGFTLALLKEAYVILIMTADGESSLAPNPCRVFAARTTDKGEIVSIPESEIDGCVPADPARAMWFPYGATYACFWTKNKDLFKAAWKDAQADPAKATVNNPFFNFAVARISRLEGPPSLFRGVHDSFGAKLNLLLYDRTGHDGNRPVHGVIDGSYAQNMGAKDAETLEHYVVARSDATAALYVAALVQRQGVERQQSTEEDWGVFEGVRDIVRHAQEKLRVRELDERLNTYETGVPAGPWNEKYHEYAYACAAARVSHDLFWRAINVMSSQSGWREAAIEIARKYQSAIPHPATEQRPVVPNKQPLMNYFDFYAFGFRNVEADWQERTDRARTWVDSHVSSLRDRIGVFMEKRSPYLRFMEELAAHQDEDPECRRKLHDFYLETATTGRYKWWEDLPTESQEKWKAVERYFNWISVLDAKLGYLMFKYFGNPTHALEMNEVLKESVHEFEHFFRKMQEYDKKFEGRTKSRRFGEGLKIRADFAKQVYVIEEHGEPIKEIGPVKFVVEIEKVPELVRKEQPRMKHLAMKKRFKMVPGERQIGKAFVPEIPFKKVRVWPVWLRAFGDTIALAICLSQLGETWKESKVEAIGKLAMNTFYGVETVGMALYWLFGAGAKVPELLEWGNTAGALIEAVFMVKEGVVLVAEGEESEVTRALERGDEFEARALRVKGWVLIASAAPGAVAFLGVATGALISGSTGVGGALATGGTAATTPLIMGVAIGAIVVVGIESVIYAHSGPDDAMKETDKKLREALKKELGEPGQYAQSRTADDLRNLQTEATRLFGVLEAR